MKIRLSLFIVMSIALLYGCTQINSTSIVNTQPGSRWGIAVFANNTEVPQAGYRAMSMVSGVLRAKGVHSLSLYPAKSTCNKLIVCPNSTPTSEGVLAWARSRHIRYVMMGAVNEWDYKVGLDGEPIASIALQLYDAPNGKLIWSSVGSKIGTSRSGLTVIAQELIGKMLSCIR